MDVRCERCRASYAFEDDQITPAGVTVQCNACGHVFRVKKKELVVSYPVKPEDLDRAPISASSAGAPRPPAPRAEAAPTPPPPPAPAPLPATPPPTSAPTWTIRQRATGQTLSFSELNTLQRWIVERKVGRDDEVTHGDGVWTRLGTLAELQVFFEVVEAADRAQGRSTSRYPAAPYPPPPAAPRFEPPPPRPLPPGRAPSAAASAGSVEIDLDEARPRRAGPSGPSSRSRNALLALLLLTAAGAGLAYLFAPALFGKGAAPPPAAAPMAVPLTITLKPPEPEPPKPEPAARPVAPEPTPEPPTARAPEPTPEAGPRPKPPGARQLLAEAARLREGNKSEQALDLYGKVLSQDAENADALAGRGLCYFDLEQYGPAEASLREALRRSPAHADALLGLAETLRATGQKTEAITTFERYLTEHPDGDEAAVARNAINQLKE